MRAKCNLQGASICAIAQQRNIQVDSVEAYLAEAITAGAAYPWHRARVPRATLCAVAAAAARHLSSENVQPAGLTYEPCAAIAAQQPESIPAQQQMPAAAFSCCSAEAPPVAAVAGAPLSRAAKLADAAVVDRAAVLHLAVERPTEAAGRCECTASIAAAADDARLHWAASCSATSFAGSAMGCEQALWLSPEQDLLKLLLERGVTVRMLKDELPESIRYGQIRLSLAHIGRLGLLPEPMAKAAGPGGAL